MRSNPPRGKRIQGTAVLGNTKKQRAAIIRKKLTKKMVRYR